MCWLMHHPAAGLQPVEPTEFVADDAPSRSPQVAVTPPFTSSSHLKLFIFCSPHLPSFSSSWPSLHFKSLSICTADWSGMQWACTQASQPPNPILSPPLRCVFNMQPLSPLELNQRCTPPSTLHSSIHLSAHYAYTIRNHFKFPAGPGWVGSSKLTSSAVSITFSFFLLSSCGKRWR